jgi:UDP-N-acetylglucosamine acyltransferase
MNNEGLKRRGFSAVALAGLKLAYKILYRQGLTLAEAQVQLAALAQEVPEVQPMVDFLVNSNRGIIR